MDIDIFDIDMNDFVVDPSLSMLAARGSFIRTFKSRVTPVVNSDGQMTGAQLHKLASAAWLSSDARTEFLSQFQYSKSEMKRRRFI